MQNFFGILFLLTFLALIVGLVKPSLVIRWGEIKTRGRVLLVYGVSMFIFMMLTGATAPELTPEQKQAKEIAKQQEVVTASAKQAQDEIAKKAKAEKEAKEQAEKNKPKLELIEHHTESDSFAWYVVGTVKNNTNKNYSYAQVSINLYDKSGTQVGSTLANINNLEPNGTWKFKAVALENTAAKYQIKEVTGW